MAPTILGRDGVILLAAGMILPLILPTSSTELYEIRLIVVYAAALLFALLYALSYKLSFLQGGNNNNATNTDSLASISPSLANKLLLHDQAILKLLQDLEVRQLSEAHRRKIRKLLKENKVKAVAGPTAAVGNGATTALNSASDSLMDQQQGFASSSSDEISLSGSEDSLSLYQAPIDVVAPKRDGDAHSQTSMETDTHTSKCHNKMDNSKLNESAITTTLASLNTASSTLVSTSSNSSSSSSSSTETAMVSVRKSTITSSSSTAATQNSPLRKSSRGFSAYPPSPHQATLDAVCKANFTRATENISSDASWKLVHTEGVLNVYRKDVMEGDRICDLLKAYSTIVGVTGGEAARMFWAFECRKEWEATVDRCEILETVDPSTIIIHNLYKRVWPSTQRDAVIMDHIRPLSGDLDAKDSSGWMVVCFSVEHDKKPSNGDKLVRATCNVTMVCRTRFLNNYIPVPNTPIPRENVACDIVYMASVDPGGWVPPGLTRTVSKREYPKFLISFDAYCRKHTKGSPVSPQAL